MTFDKGGEPSVGCGSSVFVQEMDSRRAAQRLRMRMQIRGGAWVVQVHNMSVYEMTRVEGVRAARILRSGSPCVAGTFTARVEMDDLRDALEMARRGEAAYKRRKMTPSERAWHAKYQRARRARKREVA